MRIGHHRPLFCLCAVWMLAAGLGCVLSGFDGHRMLPAGAVCAGLAAGVLSVCLLLRLLRRITARRACAVGLALLCAGLSLLNSGAYFSGQVTPDSFPGLSADSGIPASDGAGEDASDLPDAADAPVWEVRAVVAERLGGGSQITGYGLILRTVQGEPVGSALRPARAYLLCTYAANLQPGYEILLRAQAVTPEDAAGESAVSLRGDGYALGLLSGREDDCTVTAESTDLLPIRLGNLRRHLAARLEAAVGTDGLGLPSALLLGDRTALSPTLRRDFSRAGVSHLLAVSGLHLTLLFGMLALLLRFLRLPRRVRAVLLTLAAAGYLALLGFPPSATRAAVMLGFVYLSWLCAASADPLTSLGLAGALILGISPCAVADAGFWMSFSATLGLLTVPAALRDPDRHRRVPRRRALRALTARASAVPLGLFAGLVAMTFSLWITSLTVGTVSLWSPLATLLLTPLCGFVLVASLFALPLAGQWVGGTVLLPALRRVCGWMGGCAAWLGKPTGAVLSLEQPRTGGAIRAVILAVTLYLLLWLFLNLPRRMRGPALLPVAGGWVAVLLLVCLPARVYPGEVLTSYIRPTASSEALVLARGQEAVICDLTDGSRTALNAALDEAGSLGATEVSALMLTHFHTRTAGALHRAFAAATVRALWLPRPTVPEDYYRMLSCLYEARRQGVPVYLYEPGDTLTAFDSGGGGISLTLYTDRLEHSVQPVLLLHAAGQGSALTFCGGAVFESDLADIARTLAADSDLVIYGAHGPKIREPFPCTPSDRTRFVCFATPSVAAFLDPDTLPPSPPRMGIGGVRLTLRMGGKEQRRGTLERVPQTPQNFSRMYGLEEPRLRRSAGGLLKESPKPPRTFLE